MMTWIDPIVEEVHRIRANLAAAHDNDIEALGRYYQQREQAETRKPVV